MDIPVLGLGAQTVIGRSAPASAAAFRAGISRIGEHPFQVDKNGDPMKVGRASYLPEALPVVDRLFALVVPALKEALAPLRRASGLAPVPVFLGLPSARPGLPGNFAAVLTERIKKDDTLPVAIGEVTVLPAGHASGLLAVEKTASAIQSGRHPCGLACGVDSYLDPATLDWLDANEQLHAEGNPWGFMPGEGAGACLLGLPQLLRAYELKPLATIAGAGSAKESKVIKSKTVCIGEGLTAAWRKAIEAASPGKGKITQTICDLNGEPYRADEFGFSIVRLREHFEDAARYLAPMDCWGDVGAASGPLFVALAAEAGRRGYAQGGRYLLWASSEGGDRAATVVDLPGGGSRGLYKKLLGT